MKNKLVSLGAANAFIAVAAGAFGAHGLKSQISADRLAIWGTAAQYHLIHAIALVLIGALSGRVKANRSEWIGGLFLGGILLFSGSLYALALTGTKILGAITPFGGVCFLAGWALFAASAWQTELPPK